jgi:hypothetical protein
LVKYIQLNVSGQASQNTTLATTAVGLLFGYLYIAGKSRGNPIDPKRIRSNGPSKGYGFR